MMGGLLGLALASACWLVLRISLPVRPVSHPPRPAGEPVDTLLARRFDMMARVHPEQSGVQLLADGAASLAVRILLVRKAEHRIDLLYYIWRDDVAGRLLLDELQAAAERGVHVRLMVDDFGTRGLDARLKALDGHPHIEIRLFNPHRLRRWRFFNYLVDFPRLNRRLHNKLFLVDEAIAVIGGRNIGDEYFDPANRSLQADLDVMVIGAVLSAISADFGRYWDSISAVPVGQLVTDDGTDRPPPPESRLRQAYEEAVIAGDVGAFFDETADFQWAAVQLFSDDPAKARGRVTGSALMGERLLAALLPIRHSLLLVSAYFVPLGRGVDALARLAQAGIQVDVLTNSLQTNNVLPVHAGYAPSRRPLLAAGVRLWELRGRADRPAAALPAPPRFERWWQGGRLLQPKASVLHVKALTADDRWLFIGSMNFDPRSWSLNTEVGLLIEHEDMASRLQRELRAQMQADSWCVTLDRGRLAWTGDDGTVHRHEPQARMHWRLAAWLLGFLPFKSML